MQKDTIDPLFIEAINAKLKARDPLYFEAIRAELEARGGYRKPVVPDYSLSAEQIAAVSDRAEALLRESGLPESMFEGTEAAFVVVTEHEKKDGAAVMFERGSEGWSPRKTVKFVWPFPPTEQRVALALSDDRARAVAATGNPLDSYCLQRYPDRPQSWTHSLEWMLVMFPDPDGSLARAIGRPVGQEQRDIIDRIKTKAAA